LEKTIIDCLFIPEYAGGITEITKAIYKIKDKIDYSKILQYAKCFNSQAVIKRLGFLLELLEIQHSAIDELQKLRTNSVVLLEPSYSKEGKTISRWAIQQNIDTESIFKRDWEKKLVSQIHDLPKYEEVFREAKRHFKF